MVATGVQGPNWKAVDVDEVGDESAVTRDDLGRIMPVTTIIARTSFKPKAGERWIIDRSVGERWSFVAKLGPWVDPGTGVEIEASGVTFDDTGNTRATGDTVQQALDNFEIWSKTADPLTQYQRESEKGSANGYAGLDATQRVPLANLGSGTPDNTKYLRGDGTWQVVTTGGGSGDEFQANRDQPGGYPSLDGSARIRSVRLGATPTTAKFLRGGASDTAAPSWSALLAADIPALPQSKITSLEDDLAAKANDAATTAALNTKQPTAEKGEANGYAGLDATTKVAVANLGTGAASAATFLRGDRTWVAAPSAPAWKTRVVPYYELPTHASGWDTDLVTSISNIYNNESLTGGVNKSPWNAGSQYIGNEIWMAAGWYALLWLYSKSLYGGIARLAVGATTIGTVDTWHNNSANMPASSVAFFWNAPTDGYYIWYVQKQGKNASSSQYGIYHGGWTFVKYA